MNNLVTVIFSKNRPLQLYATLESLNRECWGSTNLNIKVLYKADVEYQSAYNEIASMRKDVKFIEEKFFHDQLCELIQDNKFVFFICDDTIFTNIFNVGDIIDELNKNNELIGFSLRLGTNTTKCYSLSIDQAIPEYKIVDDVVTDDFIVWNWVNAQADFSYPLEVSSSIFRVEDILKYTQQFLYSNPNAYEWMLYMNTPSFMNDKPFLMSYEISKAFSAPMNKVQKVNNNKANNDVDYSPENLLKIWNDNLKLDLEPFCGFIGNSAHQEMKFFYRNRGDK